MFEKSVHILVVDDMLTMRKVIQKNLVDLGFENIETANDGAQGWQTLEGAVSKGNPFQLVLSDWNMPEMTGIDFLKKVRADDRFKGLPFMLITAEAEQKQVMEAIQAGVSNYITKPFTPKMLSDKLEGVHKKHSK